MTALMLKDVKLSQAAAEATGTATPMAALAQSLYQQTADGGDATKDFSVVFRLLEKMTR
jgi:3-hydroxyisobutyrate dehydrogenase